MKYLIFIPLFFLVLSCQTNVPSFTIEGDIDGLAVGDTLLFTAFELPDWEELSTDTLVVDRTGSFSWRIAAGHTTFGLVNIIPNGKSVPISCFRGAALLARPGDRILLGRSAHCIGVLMKEGGFYDDPLIARFTELEYPYNLEKNEIYLQLGHQREQHPQDKDSVQKYMSLYQNHAAPEELVELRQRLLEEVDDNEYAVAEYLKAISGKTHTEVKERLGKYTSEVRSTYMGQRLEYTCRVLKNIEVGETPPPFTVVDMEGYRVSLSDYQGKYLLIYHWGLCPGTIWVQPRLLRLYEQYHELGFEVLGFTSDNYREVYANYAEDEQLGLLLDQPWRTVITQQEENRFIVKEYYFAGVPILMLISPEGKTLLRGYSDMFAPLQQILENKLRLTN